MPRIKIHIDSIKNTKSSSTKWGLGYKIAWVIDKLSWHAVTHLQTRKLEMLSQHAMCKQAIPACNSLDKLSQHAISQSKAREARHTVPACSGTQSQPGKARHAIPTYTAHTLSQHALQKLTCIKEAAKALNSRQADTALSCTTRRTRTRGAAEQEATTLWETRQEAWGIELHQMS